MPGRFFFRTILLLFLPCFALSQNQELSPDQSAALERLVKIQRFWSEHASSPGAQLVVKEVPGTKQMFAYELYAKGMPLELRYSLVALPLSANDIREVQDLGGELYLDKNGQVMDGPNDPRTIFTPDPATGQPIRTGLVSKDGSQRAVISYVPHPIEGNDNGCQITVARLLPKFELAFVQGRGFPPDSEIEFNSNSSGETGNKKLKTNQDGYFDLAVLPAVKNKSEGTIEITTVAPKCKPKVSFHWGTTE